jgi:ribonuclease BN (tRNA processing enzyme)
MRLTVIGCSGSFPGPDSPASCYLVEAEGFRLLIDLGSGALGAVARYVSPDDIDAVCLSHLHADHCLDVCSLQVARTYHPGGRRPPIPVYGPDHTALRLGLALAAEPGRNGADPAAEIGEAFTFETLSPGTIQIGPLRVTAALMNHPVQTFGFRVEHDGHSFAYSADTGETSALADLARGADVLLCEASFTEPAAGSPPLPQGLHLTARQAGEHAARAGAGELVLTHLVPWNDASLSLEQASPAFGGPVSLARSGRELIFA